MSDWFYISFADGALPPGEQFLGACYVEVLEIDMQVTALEWKSRFDAGEPIGDPAERSAGEVGRVAAVFKTQELEINPGGEAMILGPIPEELLNEAVEVADRNRLLTKAEIGPHLTSGELKL